MGEAWRSPGVEGRRSGASTAATSGSFETATSPPRGRPGWLSSRFVGRHRARIVVSVLVVFALAGGAYYSSRASEAVPRVVYSTSLDEAVAEAQAPLLVDVNSAPAEDLEELPEVGPSTAQSIVEYRSNNGSFGSLDELEKVPGIGPKTLQKLKPFATV